METPAIRNQRILELMDACRPGSDDVADPAFAELAAALAADAEVRERFLRLQRFDSVLSACFRDVPVPEGLQERLLERLAAARSVYEGAASEPPPIVVVSQPASSDSPGRVLRWRRWRLAAAAILTVAAGLLVAVWLRGFDAKEYSSQAVLDEAIRFFRAETPGPGHSASESRAPAEYRISRAVASTPQIRWRPIEGLLGRSGVAYDLSVRGARATLYVTGRIAAELPAGPPPIPMHTTAGCATSAWIEGDLLCVLVVQGDADAYRRFLAPRGPLT